MATLLWLCAVAFAWWFGGIVCYFYGRNVERRYQMTIMAEREKAIRKLWNGQIARWNEANREHRRRAPYFRGA